MDSKLIQVVNVFTCCIFTPRILTTVLPAFLLAGAIAAFMPKAAVLRYLGPKAKRIWAYLASSFSGVALSVCSCNVVPLFASIYRQGAGLGPAITFLFAGPALNIVAIIFTFQVIGWRLGLWRAIATPIIAIVAGLIVAWIYRHEEVERAEKLAAAHRPLPQTDGGYPDATAGAAPNLYPEVDPHEMRAALVVTTLLLGVVIVGSLHLHWYFQAPGMAILFGATLLAGFKMTDADHMREWGLETWSFMKTVLPVLIPVILAIGALATFIDVKWVYHLVGGNNPASIFFGAAFGSVMYFPILSEVAFTKAFLKLGMATGPALAVLMSGAGLSLPGAFVLARYLGWKKTLTYIVVVTILVALTAMLFASEVGQYLCPCMMGLT